MPWVKKLLHSGFLLAGVVSFSLVWTGQRVWAQGAPDAGKEGPQPKAMLVDGLPALSLDYGDGMGFLIVYTKFHNKPAFRFSISHIGGHSYECAGYLWVAKDEIAYTSDPAADQKMCVHKSDYTEEFELSRAEFKEAGDLGDGYFILRTVNKNPDIRWGGFHHALFVHNIAPSNRWLPLRHDHQAMYEASVAGKVAGPWLSAAFDNFQDAEKKFLQATAGVPRPPTAEEDGAISTAARIGQSEESGNLQAAFSTYISALSSLPSSVSGDQADSLRQRVFNLARKLNPPPEIPEDAKRHLAYALAAIADWKSSGDAGKLTEADDQLNQVVRLAPWRPEVYYNLGIVLEGQNQYSAAARNLKLYLLAAPNTPDADAVQQKIYQLEYKAGAR